MSVAFYADNIKYVRKRSGSGRYILEGYCFKNIMS